MSSNTRKLVAVLLDEASIGRGTPDQEHEREIAIYDLVEANVFSLPDRNDGPYSLNISLLEGKLSLDISDVSGKHIMTHILSLTPFRKLVKEYFMICETYHAAIRTAVPARIEAIDMGRRGLHNEGAQIVLERLEGKIECDFDTARRLFTLITALQWKG